MWYRKRRQYIWFIDPSDCGKWRSMISCLFWAQYKLHRFRCCCSIELGTPNLLRRHAKSVRTACSGAYIGLSRMRWSQCLNFELWANCTTGMYPHNQYWWLWTCWCYCLWNFIWTVYLSCQRSMRKTPKWRNMFCAWFRMI